MRNRAYRMDALLKHLKLKRKTNCTAPKRFDEWYMIFR